MADRFRPDAALLPLMPPDLRAELDPVPFQSWEPEPPVVLFRQSAGQVAEALDRDG